MFLIMTKQAKARQPVLPKKTSGNVLIVVLVLMVVGISLVALSLALAVSSTQLTGGAMSASRLRSAAEGGVENAILMLLRNPGTAGSTETISLEIDGIEVETTIERDVATVITATAADGSASQRYRVVLERLSGVLTVTSWQRID